MEMIVSALVATILIELVVLLLLRERRRRVLGASVFINVCTNVPLNLLAGHLHDLGDVLLAEFLVVVVEALWYAIWTKDFKQAVVYGFLCNAISFLVGLLFLLLLACFPMTW
jgi:hypothetical protein